MKTAGRENARQHCFLRKEKRGHTPAFVWDLPDQLFQPALKWLIFLIRPTQKPFEMGNIDVTAICKELGVAIVVLDTRNRRDLTGTFLV